MTTAVIIPARYESTRFPGKPLANIAGKPMIEWVVNAAKASKLANKVIVATDDKRILDFAIEKLKVEAKLTLKDHKCGTDRICEVVRNMPDVKYVVNLQGDEPLMLSDYIDKVLESLMSSASQMASLISPINDLREINNPNIVKAVMDKEGYALYFSRAPIPYIRDSAQETKSTNDTKSNFSEVRTEDSHLIKSSEPQSQISNFQSPSSHSFYKHIGIYAYSREAILKFSQLPQSSLEIAEQLEQLRALENGIRIKLHVVPKSFPSVDKSDDVKLVEDILKSNLTSSVV